MTVRNDQTLPLLRGTASRNKDGVMHISLSNVDADKEHEVTVNLSGASIKSVTGEMLTSTNLNDHNTFDNPNIVEPVDFKGAKINKGVLTVKLPAKSIVTLELK